MIQVHADGVMVYDSRLEEYGLQGLYTTRGINKGGTAEIAMHPGHPGYDSFISYKTIVEISRDRRLLFRGRALYPSEDHYKTRTITCEGELCFFNDAVVRPYLYQTDPASIFTDLIGIYNNQVEAQKRFVVGTITVTDENDYVRLESESAKSVYEVLMTLIDRCGGYIVFTTNADGARVINWYDTLGYRSNQVIEFGENLLDYARSDSNTSLATVIVPYGAQDEVTGQRVTIESVNNGVDYIEDAEAVALRGRITKAVYWDDVTVSANLLRKAQQHLSESRLMITSLQLTAIDLSHMDKSIDGFEVGDSIRVRSRPHHLDEDFVLTDRAEDLLDPSMNTITLGKEKNTLTGADVAGDNKSLSDLQKVTQQIKAGYTEGIAQAIEKTELLLTSLIEQTGESIRMEVSETYTTNDRLQEAISTSMTQLSDSFTFTFSQLKATVDENDADAREKFTEINKYIRFVDGNIILGASDSGMTLTLENDLIIFKKNGQQFGWWDGVDFHTGNIIVEVNERAQFGNFAFVPRSNGSLSFLKVGE